MFGTNEIVGQRYFRDTPANQLLVTSVFFTIQGEGPFSGLPAIFVRLAKCNLNCRMCDTWFDSGDMLSFDQLDDKIDAAIMGFFNQAPPAWIRDLTQRDKLPMYPGAVLVITGGEPLLQENLMEYLRTRKNRFPDMQIESNGTVSQDIPSHVTLVCSPKCSEKTQRYLNPSELILERADCLKFVVSGDPESPYHSVPDWVHEWKQRTGKEVYISPMNIYNDLPRKMKELHAAGPITLEQRSTVDEVVSFWEPGVLNQERNKINHEYAAKYALTNGFRFQLQTHLFASMA